MVSGSAIPPPLVEHARGSQAGARTAIDGAALTAAPLSSLTSPAAGTRSRSPLDDFQPEPDLPLAPPGKSECSHERRSEPVRVPPLVIRISGTGVRCVSDAVFGGRIHAAAGGRPERLTTTEPRDRFLEPPQASRLRHGVEATALPHRGPPIQPRARARARAKRDRHMQPVRQDHHPGGPQALNNHLEPKARQCATRDVVGATGGGLGGEVAGEAGRAAARSIGPEGQDQRPRQPCANCPHMGGSPPLLSPPMDWGECSQDTVAPTRFPPLVTPEPGTRGAACACRARPAVCGARPAVCGARLALEGVLQPWASTQACAGNPVARLRGQCVRPPAGPLNSAFRRTAAPEPPPRALGRARLKWSSQRQGVQRTQTPMLSGKGPDTCAKDLSPQEGRPKPSRFMRGRTCFPA